MTTHASLVTTWSRELDHDTAFAIHWQLLPVWGLVQALDQEGGARWPIAEALAQVATTARTAIRQISDAHKGAPEAYWRAEALLVAISALGLMAAEWELAPPGCEPGEEHPAGTAGDALDALRHLGDLSRELFPMPVETVGADAISEVED